MTRRTTEAITLLLLPISILMVAYALFVYHFRSKFLIKKQVRCASACCPARSPCRTLPLMTGLASAHYRAQSRRAHHSRCGSYNTRRKAQQSFEPQVSMHRRGVNSF